MRGAMERSQKGKHVKPSRRTVAEFLDEWVTTIDGRVRPTTLASYRDYRDAYVTPIVGKTALQDLTAVRLNLLYNHLLKQGRVRKAAALPDGLAPKTVRNVHVMLRRALRDAVRWGYLAHNPAEDAEPPSTSGRKRKVWTPEQLRTFVEHARDDRFYALWLLVATTGLRRGELAGLRAEDFDLKAGKVTPAVPRVVVDGRAQESEPKTSHGYRSLALDPVTTEAIQQHIKRWRAERRSTGHNSPLIFCWPDGQPVHPQTITTGSSDFPEPPACRSSGCTTFALLRQRRPQGGRAPQGGQRTSWPCLCRLHAPGLQPPHRRHGRRSRGHNR